MRIHEPYELAQMQGLPLEAKITLTKRRLQEWYDMYDGDIYISFSGGKDSTVLATIARELWPDIPVVFCDTGLEYPEVRSFALSFPNVTVIRPVIYNNKTKRYDRISFREVIERFGYPVVSKETSKRIYEFRHYNLSEDYKEKLLNSKDTHKRIPKCWQYLLDAPFESSAHCCEVMKKSPFRKYEKETGLHPVIATMAEESCVRMQKWLQEGCNAMYAKRPVSRPMSFWTTQDVLRYLVRDGVNYSDAYGDIIDTGGY